MDLAETNPPVEFSDCDKEPIHVPGRTQPHGALLVLDSDRIVRRFSENAPAFLGREPADVLGKSIVSVLGEPIAKDIDTAVRAPHAVGEAQYATHVELRAEQGRGHDGPCSVITSRAGGDFLVELEPAGGAPIAFRDLYVLVRQSVARLESAKSMHELCTFVCEEVRRISGYDRAKVYRFDADWNGKTIAESRAEHMASYLDLHFPASDIPAQARRLYVTNRTRQIPDIFYEPCEILPHDEPGERPIDLSYSVLRSVSPVHVQYLKNMGVRASMSISILRDGKLWGLIACHHAKPIFLPFEVRAACDYLAQVLALQLAAREANEAADARIAFATTRTKLLAHLAGTDDFISAMAESAEELLALTHADGAALVFDDRVTLVGQTPNEQQTGELIDWIETGSVQVDDLFVTSTLLKSYLPAEAFKHLAAGVLAAKVSRSRRSWIVWFRREVIQTVNWAGDPRKGGVGPSRLHPRVSFEQWRQSVADQSLPWSQHEVESARELREAMVRIVLRRAEDMAALAGELQRANKELEAFSYSVSHDLRAPFRHITGFSQLLQRQPNLDETSQRYVKTIIDASRHAGHLVDSLLAFSRMSRTALRMVDFDFRDIVEETRREVETAEGAGRTFDWEVDPLPTVKGDITTMRLVVRNLLSNAVKYTRSRDVARIKFGFRDTPEEQMFFISDNGVGFDPQYVDKLFGVFQRLHKVEDFEGTGIGLANVRRIVERHGGRTWAEGALDAGATFYFTLPKLQKD